MTVTVFQQANQLLREGKLEEAVVAYRRAIEQNPQFYGAYQNLGETLGKLGRLDQAVEMYRKSIELKPSASWLHQELGLLLERLKQNDIDDFFNLVNVSLPTDPNWLVNLLSYYENFYRNYAISNQVEHQEQSSSFNLTKFLEAEFKKDPSRFDITLALALNNLNRGSRNRGIQLLKRVAASGYRECLLAKKCLDLIMQ
ncbi:MULTISPECIES: tetratricopeptide repeat protein [unclassified Microcoleus]|uniref:tetratricopeptide repeat protein n=1 Tax=unclassified Microcoleus TaxID=2642155 RepID=UPI002FD5B783